MSSAVPQSIPLGSSSIPNLDQHIPVLDGFRGFAVILVLLLHWDPFSHAGGVDIPYYLRFFRIGWIGVELFFVLSGFLITGILLKTKEHPRYFLNFYARRALRIFPLYYLVLIVALIILPLFHWYEPSEFGSFSSWGWYSYWVFLSNFAMGIGYAKHNYLVVTWSLSMEEQFYLLWPLLMFRYSPTAIFRFGLAYLCLIPFARAFMLYGLGNSVLMVDYLTPVRLDSIVAGSILQIWLRTASDLKISQLCKSARILFPFSLFGLLIVLFIQEYYLIIDGRYIGQSKVNIFLGISVVALFSITSIILVLSSTKESILYKIFTSKLLCFFGALSYGIYLTHEMIYKVLKELIYEDYLSTFDPFSQSIVMIFLAGGLVFIFTTTSYYCFEQPILRLKKYFK